MRRQSKLRLVRGKGNTPEPVSTLSQDEQAHLLDLADIALQNKKPDKPIAGDHARQEHERLKRELKDTVDRFEKERQKSQRNDAA